MVEYNVCIDWLTCTFVIPDDAQEQIDFLETLFAALTFDFHTYEECQDVSKPQGGYSRYTTLGEFITIHYDGPFNGDGKRVSQLDMSGDACREFESRGGNWEVLLHTLRSINYNPTRLDPAIDDYTGKFCNVKMLAEKVRNKELVSLFRTWKYNDGGNLSTDSDTERILYLGSSKSDAMLRVYDKLLERNVKGYDVWMTFWNRYELQLRHDRAKLFINKILEDYNNFPKILSSVLFSYVDFKENTGKLRNDREKTCDWWTDFLGSVDKTFLKNQAKLESSISKKKEWHSHSVTKPELQIFLSNPSGFIEFILKGLEEKFPDLKEKDFATVNNELVRNGYKRLDVNDFKDLLNYYTEKYRKKQDESGLANIFYYDPENQFVHNK